MAKDVDNYQIISYILFAPLRARVRAQRKEHMIKLLKQYVEELKRANDLKERELNFMLDPYYQHMNKQQVTVKIPQLDKIELQAPNTNNPNWTVST